MLVEWESCVVSYRAVQSAGSAGNFTPVGPDSYYLSAFRESTTPLAHVKPIHYALYVVGKNAAGRKSMVLEIQVQRIWNLVLRQPAVSP